MELAIVGNDLFVLGFRLAGVRKTFNAPDAPALNTAVREAMKDPEVGILVMETRDVHRLDPIVRRDVEAAVRPTLVAIGIEEDTGLREKLKQAVGVDLWK
ncbi:MAG TPA: V-type ATP synthase subunit F [Candidatus Thermoplasmatota archaeon]